MSHHGIAVVIGDVFHVGRIHKTKFIAAAAVRELIVAINLESRNCAVGGIRPGESVGIVRGQSGILAKIRGQGGRSRDVLHQITDHGYGFAVHIKGVGKELPGKVISEFLRLRRHVVDAAGICTALRGYGCLAVTVFIPGRDAEYEITRTGSDFKLDGVCVAEAGTVFLGNGNGLLAAGAVSAVLHAAPGTVIFFHVAVARSARGIGGGLAHRVIEHLSRNFRKFRIVFADLFVFIQREYHSCRRMGDVDRHLLVIVAGHFARRFVDDRHIGVEHIVLHRDGVKHNRVLAHDGGIRHTHLRRGGFGGLPGEAVGVGQLGFHACHLHAEDLKVMLERDVDPDAKGVGRGAFRAGTRGLPVARGGFHAASAQVVPVQIAEVGGGGQNRQNLRVGVAYAVLIGVFDKTCVFIAVELAVRYGWVHHTGLGSDIKIIARDRTGSTVLNLSKYSLYGDADGFGALRYFFAIGNPGPSVQNTREPPILPVVGGKDQGLIISLGGIIQGDVQSLLGAAQVIRRYNTVFGVETAAVGSDPAWIVLINFGVEACVLVQRRCDIQPVVAVFDDKAVDIDAGGIAGSLHIYGGDVGNIGGQTIESVVMTRHYRINVCRFAGIVFLGRKEIEVLRDALDKAVGRSVVSIEGHKAAV
ncbi:hypothetical protein SDC9_65148 [bioreactor metagenome]|uniref:Uncharacterized protein n=1 Tax=bioreactor metagenome TaxID=1076179 RepID=A0A644XRI1_9ZZZZ